MIKAGGVVATRRSQPTRFAPRRVFIVVVAVVAIPAVATASARPSTEAMIPAIPAVLRFAEHVKLANATA